MQKCRKQVAIDAEDATKEHIRQYTSNPQTSQSATSPISQLFREFFESA